MTKSDTGAPLNLVTGDTSTSARPKDDYASNFSAINAEVASLRTADTNTLAAAQAYVDALIQSRPVKDPVRAVSTSNITLSGTQTVDGVSLVAGDRVLVAGQSTASQNGFYVCASGAWSRTTDADNSAEMKPGSICWVSEGTTNADSLWELTTDGLITLGTTALSFAVKAGNAAGFASQSGLTTEASTARAAEATKRTRFADQGTKTASYSAAVWDSVTYDTTSAAISQALPSAPVAGDEWEAFSTFNTTSNLLTVTGTGGPFTIYPGHGVVFRWNGSAWAERQDRKTLASLDARYLAAFTLLPLSNGTDDTANINAILAASSGKRVKGMPGQTYKISAPLVVLSNTELDMTGSTVRLLAGSNCNMVNNKAVASARTVLDFATTASSTTVTSSTGAFTSGDNGATVWIYGAGADGTILKTTMTYVNASTATLATAPTVSLNVAQGSVGPRDSGFRITGGTWDRGTVGGGAGSSSSNIFVFRRADGWIVEEISITSANGKYAINPGDCTDFTVEKIYLNTFSDGVHMNGPIKGGTIRTIRGYARDDVVSMTPNDWVGQNEVYGDITDVLVQDIAPYLTNNTCVKVLGGSSSPATSAQRITIKDIGGYATATDEGFGGLVYLGDDTGQTSTTGGWIDAVTIENIKGFGLPSNVPAVMITGLTVGSVTVDGIHYNGTGRTVGAVAIGGGSGASVDSVTVKNINARNMPNNAMITTSANVTVKALRVRDVSVNNWAGTSSGGLIANTGPVTSMDVSGVDIATATGGAIVLAVGTIGKLRVNGATFTNASNLAYVVNVLATTVTAIELDNIVVDSSGGGALVNLSSATSSVSRVQLSNVDQNAGGTLVSAITAGATLTALNVTNAMCQSTNWTIADLNTTTVLNLTNVRALTPQNGPINIRASANVTLRGRGNVLAFAPSVASGGKCTILSEDIPFATQAGGLPTLTAQSALGTTPTTAIVGSDRCGSITLTPGASPGTGNQVQVFFTQNIGANPKCVLLTPTNVAAQAAGLYVNGKFSSNFVIAAAVSPVAATAITFDYTIIP